MARKGQITGRCTVCRHSERVRIDYLCASGAPIATVARRHGLTNDAVTRHYKNHVSEAFKSGVRVGPFGSEENLRRICAESGASVLETLQAVRSGLMQRWLANLEVNNGGADHNLAMLTKQIHDSLSLQARITNEIMPSSTSVTVNNILMQDPATLKFVGRLMTLVRKFPEVREDLVALVRESFAEGMPALESPAEVQHAA